MVRFQSDRDGAAAVEFALVLPILLILIFGTMDLGRIWYAQNAMNSVAQTAGRYAILNPENLSCDTQIQTVGTNMANDLLLRNVTVAVSSTTISLPSSLGNASVVVSDITVTMTIPLIGFSVLAPTWSLSETYRVVRPPQPNPPAPTIASCFAIPT